MLDHETINENNPQLLQSYLVKMSTYISRFTLILHCLKDYRQPYVCRDTVEAAYKITSYFINCFITMAKISVKSRCTSLESHIIQWLKLYKYEEITPSRLALYHKSRFKNTQEAKECLKNIANCGFGKLGETKKAAFKWIKQVD